MYSVFVMVTIIGLPTMEELDTPHTKDRTGVNSNDVQCQTTTPV